MKLIREYQVIDPPDKEWLTRLRRDHTAYDPKQERFVRVDFAWEPPDPGGCAGRISVCPMWQEDDGWHIGTPEHSWFVKPDGTGFDGLPVLLPVSGNCPDEFLPISEPWQRQTERSLSYYRQHLEGLEEYVIELADQFNRAVNDINVQRMHLNLLREEVERLRDV